MKNTPLESEEQRAIVDYCEIRGLKFSAIPNSTYTTSWKQKMHNKSVGLRAGLPDMVIIVGDTLLLCEIKRLKGGKLSEEQRGWIEALKKCNNVEVIVSYGANEAINYIEKKLSTEKT